MSDDKDSPAVDPLCPFCGHPLPVEWQEPWCCRMGHFCPGLGIYVMAEEDTREQCVAKLSRRTPTPAPVAREAARAIYVASKTKHGAKWRSMRQAGWPIISTWIDESDAYQTLDWSNLWRRCTSEAASAQSFLLYREPGEELKGAWVELGAALQAGVPVYAVGIEEYNIAKDGRIRHFPTLDAALSALAEETDRG